MNLSERKQDILKNTGYEIVNDEKFNRAIYGMIGREGQLKGGVGEDASDLDILAEYDRLAGYVRKDSNKVKTGSFYDFDKRKPRTEPKVLLVFRDLDGNVVEIPEGEAIPLEVRAAEAIQEKKNKKMLAASEAKAKKSRKGKVTEDEE
jgi:hypothetical protein